MSSWTPDQWNTFFIFAGGFTVMTLTQVANAIISIFNNIKGTRTQEIAVKTAEGVKANTVLTQLTHDNTNNKMDLLIASTKAAAFVNGQNDQIARHAEIKAAVDAVAGAKNIDVTIKPTEAI